MVWQQKSFTMIWMLMHRDHVHLLRFNLPSLRNLMSLSFLLNRLTSMVWSFCVCDFMTPRPSCHVYLNASLTAPCTPSYLICNFKLQPKSQISISIKSRKLRFDSCFFEVCELNTRIRPLVTMSTTAMSACDTSAARISNLFAAHPDPPCAFVSDVLWPPSRTLLVPAGCVTRHQCCSLWWLLDPSVQLWLMLQNRFVRNGSWHSVVSHVVQWRHARFYAWQWNLGFVSVPIHLVRTLLCSCSSGTFRCWLHWHNILSPSDSSSHILTHSLLASLLCAPCCRSPLTRIAVFTISRVFGSLFFSHPLPARIEQSLPACPICVQLLHLFLLLPHNAMTPMFISEGNSKFDAWALPIVSSSLRNAS